MTAKPTEILKNEHRVIETVLAAMRRFADAMESGEPVDSEQLAGLVPFMREFADAVHHGKEEHRLFPRLVELGLPASNGPVQVMCAEHQNGRRLVGQLESAVQRRLGGQADSPADLAEALRTIAVFYTNHIWKEDNVLFPMAERVLGADDAANLLAAFDEADGQAGRQLRERHLAYAERLG
jgi:hemerythrin-like domain-containing protein